MIIYYGAAPKKNVGSKLTSIGVLHPDYINKHNGIGQEVDTVWVKYSVYPIVEIAIPGPPEVNGIGVGWVKSLTSIMHYYYSKTLKLQDDDYPAQVDISHSHLSQ